VPELAGHSGSRRGRRGCRGILGDPLGDGWLRRRAGRRWSGGSAASRRGSAAAADRGHAQEQACRG